MYLHQKLAITGLSTLLSGVVLTLLTWIVAAFYGLSYPWHIPNWCYYAVYTSYGVVVTGIGLLILALVFVIKSKVKP